MNYLIKGGEFNNKGAEAMTLVLIKNIYEKDADALIYMAYPQKLCPFEFIKPIYFFDFLPFFVKVKEAGSLSKKVAVYVKELIKLFIPGKTSYFLSLPYTYEAGIKAIVKK